MIVSFALVLASLPTSVQRVADGVLIPVSGRILKLEVRSANSIRVAMRATADASPWDKLVTLPAPDARPKFQVRRDGSGIVLLTSELQARVALPAGTVSFADRNGKPILGEQPDGREITPATVQGESTFHVRQRWRPNPGEAFYGLGQQQLGLLNLKGIDLDLWQRNSVVVVPFLVSSRGYGIYWDNASYSRFGDLRPATAPEGLESAEGIFGGLTASYYAGRNFDRFIGSRIEPKIEFLNPNSGDGITPPPGMGLRNTPGPPPDASNRFPGLPRGDVSIRWEGFVRPPTTGDYQFRFYSNGGIRLYVDDRLRLDHWRQSWLPEVDIAKVRLEKDRRHRIRVEWVRDQGANTFVMRWKTPPPQDETSLWSEVGEGTDYTFVYGPKLDRVIAGFRDLTGRATMLPKWSFGLWQSRQRYETQQQSLDVVTEFRQRQIPFDNIVQDWFYWKRDQWGSHEFDPERFPDPQGWIKRIHDQHANLMISVWGKFYPGTKNFDAMNAKGYLYQPNLTEGRKDWVNFPFTFYDAFNPEARKLFWSQMDRELFRKGVDAWWMDATEPDMMAVPSLEGHRTHMTPTAAGTPSRVINGYAFANAKGVYDGQRASAPDQRVFNLTRSGFAGQQRYSAVTWSGDITSTWTAMRRQIAAGLGFSVSGVPYWTMDTGGFSVPARFSARPPKTADLEEWRDLNNRWFQFATFTPFLRVHGEYPLREMWEFGGETSPTYRSMLKFDHLRYRLLPYIYALAGDVTQNDGTLLRPLVMDYPNDLRVRDLADEFMFGSAFLVSPITEPGGASRSVLLPAGLSWYDFWTGRSVRGGATIQVPTPVDQMPLHVRAGSIVPFGPTLQYTSEKPADPIDLFVYTGADGKFDLYEDDGISNGYEKGAFSQIPIRWNEAKRTLSVGKRTGSFPGMLRTRTFRVIVVDPSRPIPFSDSVTPDFTLSYSGSARSISLPFRSHP